MSAARRILVIKLSALGDVIQALGPMAARAVGISYEDLCIKVLEMARVG